MREIWEALETVFYFFDTSISSSLLVASEAAGVDRSVVPNEEVEALSSSSLRPDILLPNNRR